MPSLSKLKQSFAGANFLPATYTFLTQPFAKNLRHLGATPTISKTPQKVTVIIPNYNYKPFLDARIKSILHQTYPLYELIILDDASTDGSADYIERELLPKIRTFNPDLKIKFLQNKQNSGKSIYQWQKAFKEATGDFLWLAEADDLSDPNFLAAVMQKFDDQNVILSYSNSVAINSQGKVLTYDFQNRSVNKLKNARFSSNFILGGEAIAKREFAINCIIPNVSACVFRLDPKAPFNKYLEKSAEFTQCGDWYFYLQVLKHGSLAYSRPSLNFFRIHNRSVTASSKKSQNLLEEVRSLHTLVAKEYSLSPEILHAQQLEQSRLKNRIS